MSSVRLLLAAAFVIGVAVRLAPILATDFPLNDGGLFYAMIRDLQQEHYRLPLFTSYNGAAIPFAYPPLPFFIAGLLDDLTPLSLLDILRFVPAVATVLTLGAMYVLARSFHASEAGVAASVVTFAILPDSFVWVLMGGGLTRSLGMLCGLLGMREAHRLYAEDNPRAVPWVILWSSLTILCHVEVAWFLALTCGALCISCARSRRALVRSSFVAVATLACTAPWWVSVLLNHGWAPYAAALQAGYGTTADVSAGVIAPAQVLALAVVLLLLAARRRRLFFVGWIGLLLLFSVRSLFRFGAVPLALANGEIVGGPVLASATADAGEGVRARLQFTLARTLRAGFPVLIALLLCAQVAGSLALFEGLAFLAPLAQEERAAMAWVDENTPQSSQFLVVRGEGWAVDRSAEWFPVLARRKSVATVQGTEWLPGGAFMKAVDAGEQLDQCVHQDSRCLDSWSNEFGVSFSHLYLAAGPSSKCCELQEALRRETSYVLIFENERALVFAHA